jgi:hypothetical protein
MQTTFITTGDVPAPATGPTVYWVSLWGALPPNGQAWAVDEWRVTEAEDFLEVLRWAESQLHEGWSCEIFAEYSEPATRVDGTAVSLPRHVRLYGGPRDEPAAVERVVLTSGD